MPQFSPGVSVGLRNVGSYQVSGHPFLTGSLLATSEEKKVSFPFVTREFTVISSGSSGNGPTLRIHFNSATDPGFVMAHRHYTTLTAAFESMTYHTKCKEVFITCDANGGGNNGFELIANLTNISTTNMYALTGSGLTD